MEGGLKHHQQTNKHAFAQAKRTEISSPVWYLDILKKFTADKMTFITARCCCRGQPWSSEVETPTCCLRRVDSDAIYTNNNHKRTSAMWMNTYTKQSFIKTINESDRWAKAQKNPDALKCWTITIQTISFTIIALCCERWVMSLYCLAFVQ